MTTLHTNNLQLKKKQYLLFHFLFEQPKQNPNMQRFSFNVKHTTDKRVCEGVQKSNEKH